MIECTYSNEDLIVAQWVIIWIMGSVILFMTSLLCGCDGEQLVIATVVEEKKIES